MIGRSISSQSYLWAVGLICSLVIAGAQQTQPAANTTTVPRLVHFAGTFHPPASSPGSPVGATFAIYAAQDGGTPLWSEDQNVVLDASGSYTVLLGATSNEGVPIQLFAAGEPRWLEVKFHLPDEIGLPRVLMVSVPYALKAADAETIGGLPPSAFALAAAPTKAAANATVSGEPDAMATPAVSGTGVTGYIPLWTNSSGVPR
jgi:trimeric autotransporter adhesin